VLTHEDVAEVVSYLRRLWPECGMVSGNKGKHGVVDGEAERFSETMASSIRGWCADNKSNNWPLASHMAVWAHNTAFHSAIQAVPYEAVFGRPSRKMMPTTGLSPEVVETLTTESTLNAALGVESDGMMEDRPDPAGESKGATDGRRHRTHAPGHKTTTESLTMRHEDMGNSAPADEVDEGHRAAAEKSAELGVEQLTGNGEQEPTVDSGEQRHAVPVSASPRDESSQVPEDGGVDAPRRKRSRRGCGGT